MAHELCENQHESCFNDRSIMGDWVCLISNESGFKSDAIGSVNSNGSRDYGLFQINNYYWCTEPGFEEYNDCNMSCDAFKDDEIDMDCECANLVYARHGFDAWYGWLYHCEGTNTESWVSDCGLPSSCS